MNKRLTAIFREVMDDPTLVISDLLSRGNYARWDSLAHVKLIMALEEDYDIKFTMGEMTSLESVADINQALAAHGAN